LEKINKIELIKVKIPHKENFKQPLPTFFNNGILILKVYLRNGLIGYGEPNLYFCDEKITIENFKNYFELFIDKDLDNAFSILRHYEIHKNINFAPILSAMTQALWDISGKLQSKPIYKLINNKPSKNIKTYASAGMFYENVSINEIIDEAISFKEKHFSAYKFRPFSIINSGDHFQRQVNPPKVDLKVLTKICDELCRQIPQKYFKFMLDLGSRLNLIEAINFINSINTDRFIFIEEPLPRDKFLDNLKLKKNIKLKIAGGENLAQFKQFDLHFKNNIFEYYQPDSNLFSIDNLIKLDKFLTKGQCILHNWFSEINCNSNVNISLIMKSCNLIEYRTIGDNYREDLFYDILRPINGYIKPNDLPGLGIQINEKNLKKISDFKITL